MPASRLREYIFRIILATSLSEDENCVVEKASEAGTSYFHMVFNRESQTVVDTQECDQRQSWVMGYSAGPVRCLGLVCGENPCQCQHNTMMEHHVEVRHPSLGGLQDQYHRVVQQLTRCFVGSPLLRFLLLPLFSAHSGNCTSWSVPPNRYATKCAT